MTKFDLIKVFIFLLVTGCCSKAFAQGTDTTRRTVLSDSTNKDFIAKMQAISKKMSTESAEEFEADKATLVQDRLFEQIKKTMQKAGDYLKGGIDTTGAVKELPSIVKNCLYAIKNADCLIDKGSSMFRAIVLSCYELQECGTSDVYIIDLTDIFR